MMGNLAGWRHEEKVHEVWIGRVRSDKFRHDFVAQTFALIATDLLIFTESSAAIKWSQMQPNIMKCSKT